MLFASTLQTGPLFAQEENADCFACHEDDEMTGEIRGRTVSMYVDEGIFSSSIHGDLPCTSCHMDVDADDLPHEDELEKVDCSLCHSDVADKHEESLHGRALKRGDPLAPTCVSCHEGRRGNPHDIVGVKSSRSPVRPSRIPYLCGSCHQEGTSVQRQRKIHQDHIIENYTESIHGEGLVKRGLIVTATCVSCHTPHFILPHTDARSSIARRNIAATCAQCHSQIEDVHRKVIKGELWEKEAHVLPACVDCHQPHTIRKVFYDQGMADRDCLKCHEQRDLKAADGRSMFVNLEELTGSRHMSVACSQCHADVNTSHERPCDSVKKNVDCASCHAEPGEQYAMGIHGTLFAKNDPNSPDCKECHGTHGVLGKNNPASRTFPTKIPQLCASCHREGEPAAVRKHSVEAEHAVSQYNESIHGKGLIQSGLVVTAQCTDCHSAHMTLPSSDPLSSVNSRNVAKTCGTCHHGIGEQFEKSIHSPLVNDTDKKLPTCSDCHSAHKISRADSQNFKLEIMTQCGRCHEDIATTYFDTYHGKVSQLGFTGTAKCYDCHGAHDIMPVSDPSSHLHRDNVVQTCQKCHPGANRKFAGYLSHATHHDPEKYPYLFWTFWGMTGLLVFTFLISGIHTLLWLPRSLKWKRELQAAKEAEERGHQDGGQNSTGNEGDDASTHNEKA